MSNISDINPSKPIKDIKSVDSANKSAPSQKKTSVDKGDVVSISGKNNDFSPPKSEEVKIRDWAAQAMALEEDKTGVDRAKERLESGYYNDPEVLKTVVEELTKDLIDE
jgi:hypothetical protein